MRENEKHKEHFNSDNLLPKDKQGWWESFDQNQMGISTDNNLVVTDKYVIGVNTVGQSLKNPSYDLRAAPPCPKFSVSPLIFSYFFQLHFLQ